ncbi:SDR family oxidoreductase [Pseudoroseomonas globiformis]|uniref:SDR family oxidoreductase n=1 Tax=Teichococcus globiformis TaxID=2307229 RepID=A0ABV7G8N2_9PROT
MKQSKVAVVTGGSMGIGRATALALAQEGWAVAVLARGEKALSSTEAELKAAGVAALAIEADVADADALEAAAARVETELGPIGAWVNNAMATVISPAMEVTPDEYRRVTEVTYLGQVFGTQAALRRMGPRNRGVIIQVSSTLAIRAAPLQAAYCGAKAALHGFTDSLRSELIHTGSAVKLVTVYLPAVNTPQFLRTRNHTGKAQIAPDPVFDPRLCARAILSAINRPVRDVWVGRSTMQMAVGQALAPAVGDRIAASMWEGQLDQNRAPAEPEGNLFQPINNDPGIDGPFGDRVKAVRHEAVTSRLRDSLAIGVAALGLLGALTLMAAPVLAGKALGLARDRR